MKKKTLLGVAAAAAVGAAGWYLAAGGRKNQIEHIRREAKRLLAENRDAMDKIAEFLIEKETITGKEFMKIFRQVKGIPEPEEGKKEEKSRMGGEFAEDAASQPVQAAEALEAPTEQNPEQQN